MQISDLPSLKETISEHGLSAKKSLGQNFLLDQNITDKIVRLAGDLSAHTVIEIGPGPGGLTRSLLKSQAKKVTAIEFDSRAVEALSSLKKYAGDRLEVIESDALETKIVEITERPRVIVANLPYNIATPLLISWLQDIYENKDAYASMTLMFQKEVAERITAVSGEKMYGRLGILAQWLCDVKIVYDLPPSAFTPPPKVSSSVVHFVPKALKSPQPRFENVEKITAAAFGQRRKMIRTSLRQQISSIEALGIDPKLRAENLQIEDFINLAIEVEKDGS